MQYDKGTQQLIDDLLEAEWSYERDAILARARKLRYHDFDDNGYDMPKVELVRHLNDAGLRVLAEQAKNGRYDQDKEEARAWAQRELNSKRN